MPLRALTDALNTLEILIKQSRESRGRNDLPVGHQESLDRRIDETMELAMESMKRVVKDQASGVLDENIRKEDAGIDRDDG